MTLRTLAIVVGLFFLAGAPPAAARLEFRGDQAIIASAMQYLDAYQALNLDRLETLYAEQAAFNDPTSSSVRGIGGPFIWRGRSEVLDGMRDWIKGGVTSLKYDIDDAYEASGRVVIIGKVNPLMKTPDGAAQYRYRIVTIITIENGLVSEHRDYTDYAGVTEIEPS